MDKIGVLSEKDSVMMHAFSRLSLERVSAHSLLSLTLSFFSGYMEANVKKEVEKDRLIIRESASAFEAGRPACDLDLEDIFEKTKRIDREFLDGLTIPSFAVHIRYSDFSDIRIQRIWRIARTVYGLLGKWPDGATFSDAARRAYAGNEFKEIIVDILHLYSLETRMLGDSIRSPFHTAISAYTEAVFRAMEETTEKLANSYTEQIFGAAVQQAIR